MLKSVRQNKTQKKMFDSFEALVNNFFCYQDFVSTVLFRSKEETSEVFCTRIEKKQR